MFNFLKVIRYLVFLVFIVSNTIVTSVAVWNLSIVEGSMRFSVTATVAASFLIAVAAIGLLVIFPILILEIAGKRTFLGVVWFEVTWTGILGTMTLVGASLITSLSSRELCVSTPIVKNRVISSPPVVSPCSSAQVLGVFTWMPATFLLSYMTLLSILAFVQSKEDPDIWKSSVRDMPVDKIMGEVRRNSIIATLPQIRKSPPVIHAPRPRHIIPPLLDCRSSRNSAYDFQQPSALSKSAPVRQSSRYRPSVQGPVPYTSTAFYNSSVQKVIDRADRSRMPPLQRPVPPVPSRRGQTSPPPLGDWPRMDATSRPRTKRYRSNPQAPGPVTQETPTVNRESSRRSVSSPARSRTAPSSATAVPFVERPSVPHRPSRTRTKPPGSGRSGSVDKRHGSSSPHRPPPLDLSRISTHLSRSERSRARAGR